MPLDKLDARLLDLVQRNNRLSSEELGALVGLSASGVQRRLKRMRADGLIEADVAIVSPKAVGRHVTLLVLISFERDASDTAERFKQAVRNMPEVMSGFLVTGEADFVLMVTAKDMDEYAEFKRRLVSEHSEIKRVESIVVLDRIKTGFTVPISPIACW